VKREFSAGGVVVRRFRGRPFLCAVRVSSRRAREAGRPGELLALPKGHPEPGESSSDAATREVREETGVTAVPLGKLGDVRYWYVLNGERVLKIVSFFLFRYHSGSVRDHDHEVDGAEWIPLEDGPRRLAYKGDREMAELALSRLEPER
jgi:8-oxo-dGTP pyrophosphatase MutT (NUDIX family)